MPEFITRMFVPAIIIAAVAVLIIVLGYVKSPPDKAYIISGLRKKSRVLIGRAGIRVPFFERIDKLYLGQMTVDIKTEQSVPTNDFINVNVDAVAKVRIMPTEEGIRLAAKNFLNKKPDEITVDLQDSLQGNMREIIGTLSLKSINTDRDSFSDQVMMKASKDMEKLGIEILSCNIQNVTDENGLIRDLGADNTARIKKDAAIAKAQADRDVAIEQAKADQEANEARVTADTEIAQRRNELAIKQAELKVAADTKQATADAAYEIQRQEQERSIGTATVNAQIARADREAELKQKEVSTRRFAPRPTRNGIVRNSLPRRSSSNGKRKPKHVVMSRNRRPKRSRKKPRRRNTPRNRKPQVSPQSVKPKRKRFRQKRLRRRKVSIARRKP